MPYAMARLSICRETLADRNTRLPPISPLYGAALGRPDRAEALARTITNGIVQAWALAEVATVVEQAGAHRPESRRLSVRSPRSLPACLP